MVGVLDVRRSHKTLVRAGLCSLNRFVVKLGGYCERFEIQFQHDPMKKRLEFLTLRLFTKSRNN